jgi:predicted outer membrane repeat protein
MNQNWLRGLKSHLVGASGSAPRRARLQVEKLEERDVPATFTVSNANDDGMGSLRQAIRDANKMAGADTITFSAAAFPAGTQINLTSGAYVVNDFVTIQGPGAGNLTINAGGTSRIFTVDSAAASNGGAMSLNQAGTLINVSISGMTLANGKDANGGGAILDNGENVTLNAVQVDGNTSTATNGGAILVVDATSVGSLTVSQSSFTNNSAPNNSGGAISVQGNEGVTIRNTTFDGNKSPNGGAIFLFAGGAQTLEFNTFSNNVATTGGAVYVNNATALLNGNILAGNTAMDAANGPDLFVQAGTSLSAASSYNDIVAAAGAGLNAALLTSNNNRSVDPALGALTTLANGTKARAPQNVNLIDQVPANLAPMVDQGGKVRPVGAAADIGAVEVGTPAPPGGGIQIDPVSPIGPVPGSMTGSPFAVPAGTNVTAQFRVTSAVSRAGKSKKRSQLTVSVTNLSGFDAGAVQAVVTGFQRKGKKRKPFTFTMSFPAVAAGQTVKAVKPFTKKNGRVTLTATTITTA